MKNNHYSVILTPEEFYWLWEDVELALQSAQKKAILRDKNGKFHDLTEYKTVKLLKGLKTTFEKADKERK